MPTPVKFQVGRVYRTRSLCDYDCIFEFDVIGRTAQTVTIRSKAFGTKRRKVFVYDGTECINPLGVYSMSPVLRAG